jgi:hypothetical protein
VLGAVDEVEGGQARFQLGRELGVGGQ